MTINITAEIEAAYRAYLDEEVDTFVNGEPIRRRHTYPYVDSEFSGMVPFAAGFQAGDPTCGRPSHQPRVTIIEDTAQPGQRWEDLPSTRRICGDIEYASWRLSAGEPCPRGNDKPETTCTNRHQCWEPCGELGKSEEHVRVGRSDPAVIDRILGIKRSPDKQRVADFVAGVSWRMSNPDASLDEMRGAAEWWADGVTPVDEHQGFAFRKHLAKEGIATISATDTGLSRALSAWLAERSAGVTQPAPTLGNGGNFTPGPTHAKPPAPAAPPPTAGVPSVVERVPCSRCTSEIYCEMNGCKQPAAGVRESGNG